MYRIDYQYYYNFFRNSLRSEVIRLFSKRCSFTDAGMRVGLRFFLGVNALATSV